MCSCGRRLGEGSFGDGFKYSDEEEWIEEELTGCCFPDARLGDRLCKLLEGMAGAIGESLPMACQDWANTMAAYRLFDHDRVSEGAILEGHFRATADRFASVDDPIPSFMTPPTFPINDLLGRRSVSRVRRTADVTRRGVFGSTRFVAF